MSPQIVVVPDPVHLGQDWTLSGAGFNPGQRLVVACHDAGGTMYFVPECGPTGDFSLVHHSYDVGLASVGVFPNPSRGGIHLMAATTFEVVS